jgi:L-ascorbate metabolism protein UlaG (beta-lactamase superfamily)
MKRVLFVALCMSVALPALAQKALQEDTFKTAGGDLTITLIGHGTLMFTFSGKTIHVDPVSSYADYATLPKADLILITHEHGDHLDAKAIQAISTDRTVLVVNPGSAGALPAATVMRNGEAQTFAGVRVEAVPAYNPAGYSRIESSRPPCRKTASRSDSTLLRVGCRRRP